MTEKDRWLILATDGMWNQLKRRDIAKIVSQVEQKKQDAPDTVHVVKHLLDTALDSVCYNEGITRAFLGDLEPGERKRMLSDDITILVVDLQNQFKAK